MNFLNVDLSKTYDSPEFTGSDPIARATWFCLSCYCARLENGGRILGCKTWGERRWPQTAKVFKPEVDAAVESGLLEWDANDLIVLFYPADQEAALHRKQNGGKTGMKSRWGKKPDNLVNSTSDNLVMRERKGKEKERNSNQSDTTVKESVQIDIPKPEIKKIQVKGYAEISDTANCPIDLASSITGDFSDRARGYWRVVLDRIGSASFRSQLNTLWGECNAGERPANPAACLNIKFKKILTGSGRTA